MSGFHSPMSDKYPDQYVTHITCRRCGRDTVMPINFINRSLPLCGMCQAQDALALCPKCGKEMHVNMIDLSRHGRRACCE